MAMMTELILLQPTANRWQPEAQSLTDGLAPVAFFSHDMEEAITKLKTKHRDFMVTPIGYTTYLMES